MGEDAVLKLREQSPEIDQGMQEQIRARPCRVRLYRRRRADQVTVPAPRPIRVTILAQGECHMAPLGSAKSMFSLSEAATQVAVCTPICVAAPDGDPHSCHPNSSLCEPMRARRSASSVLQ